jgi:hypothetical protein
MTLGNILYLCFATGVFVAIGAALAYADWTSHKS